MNPSPQLLVCLAAGVGLMFAEVILPGFVSVFIGMAGVLVAAIVWLGWLEGWTPVLFTWLGISIFLILTLRSTLMKFFPGDKSVGSMDEDADAKGSVVEVVKAVSSGNNDGQIMFRDAVWSARSAGKALALGTKARLVRRENLVWVVEADL